MITEFFRPRTPPRSAQFITASKHLFPPASPANCSTTKTWKPVSLPSISWVNLAPPPDLRWQSFNDYWAARKMRIVSSTCAKLAGEVMATIVGS